MTCKIYLEPGDGNDATSFYIEMIERSLQNQGYAVERVDGVDKIDPEDLVWVIQAKAFYRVRRRNKKQRIRIWFQGIVPEEAKMQFPNPLQWIPRMAYWRFLERYALKNAELCLFVSHAMRQHYRKRYGYRKENFLVVPCFNLELDKASFFVEGKYAAPRFVYAGSMAAWQCVDQTAAAYALIEQRHPNASLTWLTNEADRAQELVEKYGIKNYEIKYVDRSELNAELAKYKYGFLLRQDTAVNNVATPTKMNSYMAAGVVPVYSEVVGDFKAVFGESRYAVRVEGFDVDIEAIERTPIDPQAVYDEYRALFDAYYNAEKYIHQLTQT